MVLFTRPRHPGHVTAGALALTLLPALWPSDAAAHTCDDPFSTDLIAGQTIDAGDVKVCNDDTTLTVTYEATFPWCLLKTDLHVATSKSGIPQNKPGNPIPGQFAYGDEYGGCLDGPATFEIPLADIGDGVEPEDTVFIAAHAEVEDGEREEGAWGAGTRFVKRGNWAMYFTYTVQEPVLCGGDTSKCVFVTSTLHDGNLGGLAGADAICNARATEAGLPGAGSYLAWLSAGGVSPSTRFTQAAVPYKRVDGTTVAGDWADLVDRSLAAPIQVTEGGIEVGRLEFAWTGTAPSGVPEGNECLGWVVANSQAGRMGSASGMANEEGGWTSFAIGICFTQQHLYCFQQ